MSYPRPIAYKPGPYQSDDETYHSYFESRLFILFKLLCFKLTFYLNIYYRLIIKTGWIVNCLWSKIFAEVDAAIGLACTY
jgi:hypothetical protein